MILLFSVKNYIFNYYKVLSLIQILGWVYNKEKWFTGKSKEFFISYILHWKNASLQGLGVGGCYSCP